MRARFDLPKQGDDTSGIGSILLDFDHQFLYLLIPQANVYLQIEGSAGTPFYSGAWMFRPYSAKYPRNDWMSEADRRGITLRCKSGEQDICRWTTDAEVGRYDTRGQGTVPFGMIQS
jgi:hypothetical protein